MPFCANGGKEIPAGNASCQNCGAPVQAGGQPAPMYGTVPQVGPGPQGASKSMDSRTDLLLHPSRPGPVLCWSDEKGPKLHHHSNNLIPDHLHRDWNNPLSPFLAVQHGGHVPHSQKGELGPRAELSDSTRTGPFPAPAPFGGGAMSPIHDSSHQGYLIP